MPKSETLIDAVQRMADHVQTEGVVRAQVSGEASHVMLQGLLPPGTPDVTKRILQGGRFSLNEILHPHEPPAAPPTPPPLPDSMDFQTGAITFSGRTPVNGYATLTVYKNGNYEFWGHFHDSGAPSYDAALVWIIVGKDGTAFSFAHKVHLNGTFEAGSRDGDWNDAGNNPQLAAHWADLVASYHFRWQANVNWDWTIIVKQVEDAMKVAGTIIGAVVSVVALL